MVSPAGARQRVGALEVDRRRHRAALAGRPLALSPRQFVLLAALAAGAGERAGVPRAALVEAVYGPAVAHQPIDQYLYRLRRALRDAGAAAGVAPPTIVHLGGPRAAYRLVA